MVEYYPDAEYLNCSACGRSLCSKHGTDITCPCGKRLQPGRDFIRFDDDPTIVGGGQNLYKTPPGDE